MAIDSGILVNCEDLNAVGGVRQVILTDLSNITAVAPATYSAATGALTSITHTVDWARYENKQGMAALTVNGTKENGATKYEVAVSFYIPNIEGGDFAALKKLESACPVAVVELFSGKMFVVGWSYVYQNQAEGTEWWKRSQNYANLTSIEGGSGTAITDENGVTVTLTATQWELPLEYTGAITVESGDLTASTS